MSDLSTPRKKIKPVRRYGWIRCYHDELDDPTIRLLPDHLRLLLHDLRLLTGRNRGYLPDIDRIRFCLRMELSDVEVGIHNLLQAGLLTWVRVDGDEVLQPTNWWHDQPRSDHSGAARMRKMRAKKKGALQDRDAPVTDDVTSRVTESSYSRSHSTSTVSRSRDGFIGPGNETSGHEEMTSPPFDTFPCGDVRKGTYTRKVGGDA